MLSYIFVFMIGLSVVGSVVLGRTNELSQSVVDGAYDAVELLITMSGMMCLWSGVMEVAKESGLTDILAKLLSPIMKKLFPDVSEGSEAFKSMSMNVSANLLGMGNAATPLGLKAMREIKKESSSDVATDSMITFVVMNTASIQLLPTTLGVLRAAQGSRSPFDIVFCVWVTSALALAVGLTFSKIMCKGGKRLGTYRASDNGSCFRVRSHKKSKCV